MHGSAGDRDLGACGEASPRSRPAKETRSACAPRRRTCSRSRASRGRHPAAAPGAGSSPRVRTPVRTLDGALSRSFPAMASASARSPGRGPRPGEERGDHDARVEGQCPSRSPSGADRPPDFPHALFRKRRARLDELGDLEPQLDDPDHTPTRSSSSTRPSRTRATRACPARSPPPRGWLSGARRPTEPVRWQSSWQCSCRISCHFLAGRQGGSIAAGFDALSAASRTRECSGEMPGAVPAFPAAGAMGTVSSSEQAP